MCSHNKVWKESKFLDFLQQEKREGGERREERGGRREERGERREEGGRRGEEGGGRKKRNVDQSWVESTIINDKLCRVQQA